LISDLSFGALFGEIFAERVRIDDESLFKNGGGINGDVIGIIGCMLAKYDAAVNGSMPPPGVFGVPCRPRMPESGPTPGVGGIFIKSSSANPAPLSSAAK
jgi:hypothetical protein